MSKYGCESPRALVGEMIGSIGDREKGVNCGRRVIVIVHVDQDERVRNGLRGRVEGDEVANSHWERTDREVGQGGERGRSKRREGERGHKLDQSGAFGFPVSERSDEGAFVPSPDPSVDVLGGKDVVVTTSSRSGGRSVKVDLEDDGGVEDGLRDAGLLGGDTYGG